MPPEAHDGGQNAYQPRAADAAAVASAWVTPLVLDFGPVGVGLNNALPAGLKVASPSGAAASPECNSPTITTAPGSSSIVVTDGAITGGKACVITVQVKPEVAGDLVNAVAVSSVNGGTGNTATATLVVRHKVRLPIVVRQT